MLFLLFLYLRTHCWLLSANKAYYSPDKRCQLKAWKMWQSNVFYIFTDQQVQQSVEAFLLDRYLLLTVIVRRQINGLSTKSRSWYLWTIQLATFVPLYCVLEKSHSNKIQKWGDKCHTWGDWNVGWGLTNFHKKNLKTSNSGILQKEIFFLLHLKGDDKSLSKFKAVIHFIA